MIENPANTLGSYWRTPDSTFHPNEFGGWPGGNGDDYRKRTCLWTGGGFRFPQKRPIDAFRPLYIHNMPPANDRGDLRSITPHGFAKAVFEANVGRLQRPANDAGKTQAHETRTTGSGRDNYHYDKGF